MYYFNSTEPNLASPMILKSIETIKLYFIPMKVPKSQKSANVDICNYCSTYVEQLLPKYSRNLFVQIFGEYSHTLLFLLLKFTYFNSLEHNIAPPLILKSIETIKSYLIPMKVPNSQKAANVENMQLLHHLRRASCLNTAEMYLYEIISDYGHLL